MQTASHNDASANDYIKYSVFKTLYNYIWEYNIQN